MDAWKKGATEAMNKQYFSRPENLKSYVKKIETKVPYAKGLKKPKAK